MESTSLPPDANVYPTHGFGSFCSATQSAGNSSPNPNHRSGAATGRSNTYSTQPSMAQAVSCGPTTWCARAAASMPGSKRASMRPTAKPRRGSAPDGEKVMFYDAAKRDHGLPQDPLKSLIVPRPIGWISTIDGKGRVNLAPYSFYNGVSEYPPMVYFAITGSYGDTR